MHKILLSLAANCNHKVNLSEARRRLEQVLVSLSYSRELWTEPVGTHTGCMYLNQLAVAQTDRDTDDLCRLFKDIEAQMGRTDEDRLQGKVCIDLDLLQYDAQRHHLRDWERTYVTQLLPDVEVW